MFKKIKIFTHSGSFHPDEIFACAVLKIYLKKKYKYPRIKIIRTRDLSLAQKGDYMIDVGMEYNPAEFKFDHHQNGNKKRKNGIAYASFGLLWKEYGYFLCENEEVFRQIDGKLAQPIDALDNGVDLFDLKDGAVVPYTLNDLIETYNFFDKSRNQKEKNFFKILVWVEEILNNEILKAKILVEQKKEVEKIVQNNKENFFIVFGKEYSEEIIQEVLKDKDEILFFVQPSSHHKEDWKVQVVGKKKGSFEARKNLPLEWAGKRDEDLQKITGVKDAVFCHNGRFMIVVKSREGALELVRLAI